MASYAEHPVRGYFERGVVISINTDDPKMFGNSLAEEYMMLVAKKGFTPGEIKELVLGAIGMSWMPEERKRQMVSSFEHDPAWSVKFND